LIDLGISVRVIFHKKECLSHSYTETPAKIL
jgi:hypothetical protein